MRQNVTAHTTADWTLQQFREALPGDHACRFMIHDRDQIYSKALNQAIEAMGAHVSLTTMRARRGILIASGLYARSGESASIA